MNDILLDIFGFKQTRGRSGPHTHTFSIPEPQWRWRKWLTANRIAARSGVSAEDVFRGDPELAVSVDCGFALSITLPREEFNAAAIWVE